MPAAMKMVHGVDPRNEIQKNVGSLDEFTLFGNQVLIGVYQRPEKTASGLYISDKTRSEDEHQGKVGLVLKKGPQAFVDDQDRTFGGQNVELGDWVAMWVTDGRKIVINKQLCRVVTDEQIRLKVPAPDVVF